MVVMVAIFSALVSREALEDSGIRKTKINFGGIKAKLKRSDFLVMAVTTTILFKKEGKKKKGCPPECSAHRPHYST